LRPGGGIILDLLGSIKFSSTVCIDLPLVTTIKPPRRRGMLQTLQWGGTLHPLKSVDVSKQLGLDFYCRCSSLQLLPISGGFLVAYTSRPIWLLFSESLSDLFKQLKMQWTLHDRGQYNSRKTDKYIGFITTRCYA